MCDSRSADGATFSSPPAETETETKACNTSGDEEKSDKDSSVIQGYNPKLALKRAVEDWIPEFYQPKGSSARFTASAAKSQSDIHGKSAAGKGDTDVAKLPDNSGEPCDDDMETNGNNKDDDQTCKTQDKSDVRDSGKRKMEELEPLSIEDVQTICDLFYLPFQHGSRGVYLLKEAHWLVQNASRVKDCYKIPQSEQVKFLSSRWKSLKFARYRVVCSSDAVKTVKIAFSFSSRAR